MGRKNFKKRNDRLENRVEVGVKTVLERDLPHTSLLLLISARPVEEWRTSFALLFLLNALMNPIQY